jgi:hypothetical protein
VKRKGNNGGRERFVGKAAGDECVFIPGAGVGLADGVGPDAIPDAAGDEGGHGAAKPEGVIHRYIFNKSRKDLVF